MRWLAMTLLFCSLTSLAAIDAYQFPDEGMRERYNQLIDELRCPQCLNTNLAGSDAMIAKDLRREVHRLLLDGQSDDEILNFMHQRYGDFILYSPRLKPSTMLLWFGPLAFLLIGAAVMVIFVRGRAREPQPLSAEEVEKLNKLTQN